MINWINVKSSNLDSIAYDETFKFLFIKFHQGGTYKYLGMPKNIFEELLKAESHGKYHAKHIKKNFKYEKI